MSPGTSSGSPENDALVEAVVRGSRALVAITARSLAGGGDDVTLPQYRLLVVLTTRGPQRLRDLAVNLGVNPSTATRMCDRLHRKGLLTRRPVPDDRRAVELVISDDGRAMVERVLEQRRAEVGRLLTTLTPEQRVRAAEGLQILAEATGEPARQGDVVESPVGEADVHA
ncbi:MarR family transcriptional regulator [Haloactinopolyspora alba]|uniref:MarR family transcriptional regulator n=1 Tax=Haloactinopolyspora alba TaxID=648780 RepID=A0A2P8E523_9ACTN|nr:MarR family transcriptional regulator [Haloactinopolyspora alba]PSL04566.1 MarR family transcriptional regulator [Haloactinopolyspora alba]